MYRPRYNYLASFADRIAHPYAIQADMALDSFKERQHPVKIPFNKIIMPSRDHLPAHYEQLAENILEHGMRKPITVARTPLGYYRIVDGFLRCLAMMDLELEEIDAEIIGEEPDPKVRVMFSHGPHSVMKAYPKVEDMEATD